MPVVSELVMARSNGMDLLVCVDRNTLRSFGLSLETRYRWHKQRINVKRRMERILWVGEVRERLKNYQNIFKYKGKKKTRRFGECFRNDRFFGLVEVASIKLSL